MATNFIDKATELREDAWREVQTSPSFLAFKALDDAVAMMGGERKIAPDAPRADAPRPSVGTFSPVKRGRTMKKSSQSDVAVGVLKGSGEPLPIGRLMEASLAWGATIGGANPLANFRSALSKDKRFISFKRNNMYFWWIDGWPLPPKWNEAPDLLAGQPDASSVHSTQEGGDDHAATITTARP